MVGIIICPEEDCVNNTGCLAVVNFGECGHGAGMDASIRGVVFVLFVASSVSGVKVETIARAILPFLAVEVLVIFLITYFPIISLGVPVWLGFVKDADLLGPVLRIWFYPFRLLI